MGQWGLILPRDRCEEGLMECEFVSAPSSEFRRGSKLKSEWANELILSRGVPKALSLFFQTKNRSRVNNFDALFHELLLSSTISTNSFTSQSFFSQILNYFRKRPRSRFEYFESLRNKRRTSDSNLDKEG
ncbi:hypothetical protein TNIN_306691 [Trichonephila inaurata madagascariensis]|uniref:Uncharacterized protein n=1 Tax=Trichonephila inaurata madagascariensis TaxID=2747483 RepID=A0A8X7CPP7_9ARAC|nr:hypothetical protein TNIN_306691 [Trichonephila inaurata madagascariensis]